MELASIFSKKKKDGNYSECLWQLKMICEHDIANLERERACRRVHIDWHLKCLEESELIGWCPKRSDKVNQPPPFPTQP